MVQLELGPCHSQGLGDEGMDRTVVDGLARVGELLGVDHCSLADGLVPVVVMAMA
jgi:hypothetical protein